MTERDRVITDRYAIYRDDCMNVLSQIYSNTIHLSIYSPPFGGLYHYSSSIEDLSNSTDYGEFFDHYRYIVSEIFRVTLPGRMTAVHCMDVPTGNTGSDIKTSQEINLNV